MNPNMLTPERQLVGSAMLHARVLEELVPESDFANMQMGALWTAMVAMHTEGLTVNAATVAGELHRIPSEQRVGLDHVTIVDLLQAAPPTEYDGIRFARQVREHAALRRLESAGVRIAQLARGGHDSEELLELARGELEAVPGTTATGVTMLGDVIDSKIQALDEPAKYTPTPWTDLNEIIRGWRPGALYVLGARPGVGKTIFGLQAAIALADTGAVAFASLEMTDQELMSRVIAQTAEVPLGRLDGTTDSSDTQLTQRDWKHIAATRARWQDMPLAINDHSGSTVESIVAHARAVNRETPLAAIVVDYLQLMTGDSRDPRPRHEVVAAHTRALKLAAKDLGVPVLLLSQLNRASQARNDKRPTLADLRESGAIEQDADVVLLLHSEDDEPDDVNLLVAKNRHGATGVVELIREGHYARLLPRVWTPARALHSNN